MKTVLKTPLFILLISLPFVFGTACKTDHPNNCATASEGPFCVIDGPTLTTYHCAKCDPSSNWCACSPYEYCDPLGSCQSYDSATNNDTIINNFNGRCSSSVTALSESQIVYGTNEKMFCGALKFKAPRNDGDNPTDILFKGACIDSKCVFCGDGQSSYESYQIDHKCHTNLECQRQGVIYDQQITQWSQFFGTPMNIIGLLILLTILAALIVPFLLKLDKVHRKQGLLNPTDQDYVAA